MELTHIRLQLLAMANGDVESAKHMENYIFSDVGESKCAEGGFDAPCGSTLVGRAGGCVDAECPPPNKPKISNPRLVDGAVRICGEDFGCSYSVPENLINAVDAFFSSLDEHFAKK